MAAPVARQRGSIRRRARCWEIRVSAGEDPSTGERIVLVDSVQIEGDGERAERTAYKQAEKVRTRLLADADELKVARTKATVGALLERFMAQHEVDETTRMNYASQIRRYIEPKLGDVPLVLFVREAAQRLEPWYAQLRRCGALCNGRSFIERVAVGGPGRSPWRGGRVAVGGPRSGGRCGAARRELRPCVRRHDP